ncbi:MAG: hypothetical protein IKX70_04720 [Treponema sp.]|nr:hypothetical protein [Treponema sp.]MBR5032950.1 hypothetical protein [Treponema sp.]
MKKSVFLICIAALFFTSCENFLKGSDVKNQLEEAIEIANASPVTFIVTADEGSGTLKTLTLQLKKKNTFDLVFEPAETYRFIKWEVLDRATKKPVEGVLTFEDETNPETKGTAVSPREGLEIHAKCILQPAVVSVNPSPSGQNQINAAIKIKFNMPVNDTAVDYVSLTYLGQNVADDYFYKPVLNDSKDEITIRPKTSELITFIDNLKKGFADIRVSLPPTITAIIDGESVPLYQNTNASFDFHYILTYDSNPPYKNDFYLSRTFEAPSANMKAVAKFHNDIVLIGEGECTSSNFDKKNDPQDILDNTSGAYIYIYGNYHENESAVETIKVYEQFCGVNSNWYFDQKVLAAQYSINDNNVNYFIDADGNTIFCIKHELKCADGAVRVSIDVEDVYGNSILNNNSADLQEITVFKMTTIPVCIPGNYSFYNERMLPNFNETSHNEFIKTLSFYGGEEDNIVIPYSTYITIPYSYFNVKCEYKHTDGSVEPESFTHYRDYEWSIDLDVDQLSGLQLKLIITDDFGNLWERQYNIPESQNYKGIVIPDAGNPPDTATVMFYYTSGELPWAINQLIDNNGVLSYDNTPGHDYEMSDTVASIDKDITYRFIPCVGFDTANGSPSAFFYTEVPPNTYSIISGNTLSNVVLKDYEDTGNPYRITKNPVSDLLDVTVQISENQPEDYDEIILLVKDNALITGNYNEAHDLLIGFQEGNKYQSFQKNAATGKINTECTVTAITELMFDSPTDIVVYGIKNGKSTSGTEDTIELTYSDTDYDNYNNAGIDYQYKNVIVNDCDTVTVNFYDGQSGISTTRSYIIEGDDIPDLYGTQLDTATVNRIGKYGRVVCGAELAGNNDLSQGKIQIPRWMFTDTGFSYYFRDRGGNLKFGTIPANNSQLYHILRLETKEDEKNSPKTQIDVVAQETSGSQVKPEMIEIYQVGSTTPCTTITYSNADSLKLTDSAFPSNTFIKVVIKLPDEQSSPWNRYTHPAYIYTGKSNSGTMDYIYPAYNGKIAINSDAPVMARTVVTSASYEECKNWSVSKWENGRKYIREEVLNCDGISHAYYKIYNTDNDIEDGSCYAVIVHFADGSKAMSQIMQKSGESL